MYDVQIVPFQGGYFVTVDGDWICWRRSLARAHAVAEAFVD